MDQKRQHQFDTTLELVKVMHKDVSHVIIGGDFNTSFDYSAYKNTSNMQF